MVKEKVKKQKHRSSRAELRGIMLTWAKQARPNKFYSFKELNEGLGIDIRVLQNFITDVYIIQQEFPPLKLVFRNNNCLIGVQVIDKAVHEDMKKRQSIASKIIELAKKI